MHKFFWHFFVAACCSLLSTVGHAEWSLLESWKAHPSYRGSVPNKSDVIFSTRFERDEAPAIAREFGATRIEWVYSSNPKFIARLRETAPWYGGTMNSTTTLRDKAGVAHDLENRPIVAPWMKSWGAQWITTSYPQTKAQLFEIASSYLLAGVDSIQIDDPLLQYATHVWGGDFSNTTLIGFRSFLERHPDQALIEKLGLNSPELDYREYLRKYYGITTVEEYLARQSSLPSTPIWRAYLLETVRDYYIDLRAALSQTTGRRFPLSMNLSLFGPDEKRDGFTLTSVADYVLVETKIDSYDLLTLQAATYRALALGYVPSIQPINLAQNRWAIASLYSLGAQPLVPWDVFVVNDEQSPGRFFGNPQDYADIFQFVRRNKSIFDNFERLVAVGIFAPTSKYKLKETLSLVRRLNRLGVPFAIVPIGRDYAPALDTLKHFRLLLQVNSEEEIGTTFLKRIRAEGLRVVGAEEISDTELRAIAPFSGNSGWAQVTLFANTHDSSQLTIHVVPTNPSSMAEKVSCDKEITIEDPAFRKLSITQGTLYGPRGASPIDIKQIGEKVALRWTECRVWGVGLLTTKH